MKYLFQYLAYLIHVTLNWKSMWCCTQVSYEYRGRNIFGSREREVASRKASLSRHFGFQNGVSNCWHPLDSFQCFSHCRFLKLIIDPDATCLPSHTGLFMYTDVLEHNSDTSYIQFCCCRWVLRWFMLTLTRARNSGEKWENYRGAYWRISPFSMAVLQHLWFIVHMSSIFHRVPLWATAVVFQKGPHTSQWGTITTTSRTQWQMKIHDLTITMKQ